MDPEFRQQEEALLAVSEKVRTAQRILFVTGAGMSAESGLPTYRGVGGLYNDGTVEDGLTIEECLSQSVFLTRPELTWKYLGAIEQAARNARYNRGHEVIALLQEKYSVSVLTQNIDGFHLKAGSRDVIEIHGALRKLHCTSFACDFEESREDYCGLKIPPQCPKCNSMLRPQVVLFDEALPVPELTRISRLWDQPIDIVFSIGTSSSFPYIANEILLARERGKPTVEINPQETRLSQWVDYHLKMPSAKALDQIWQRIQSG